MIVPRKPLAGVQFEFFRRLGKSQYAEFCTVLLEVESAQSFDRVVDVKIDIDRS